MALIWAGAALTVVNGLLIPIYIDDVRAEFRRAAATSSAPRGARDFVGSEDFLQFAVILGLVFLLVQLGLWVWMAVKTRQGRNWARVLGTVLGSLWVLVYSIGFLAAEVAPAMGSDPDLLNRALSVIGPVLALAIIVLLWLPDSNRWFASMRPTP